MDAWAVDSDVEYVFTLLSFRKFKDGRLERLHGEDVVPPSDPDRTTAVSSKDVVLHPDVTARLYLPHHVLHDHENKGKRLPVLVYYHGGGFCLETPFSPVYHPYLNALVSQSNIIAVSVHYRRATEHLLPTAYHDSWTALQWVASHYDGAGQDTWLNGHADFNHLFLAGDSAGANIVHNLTMRAGTEPLRGSVKVEGIVLVHPYFWGEERLESESAFDASDLAEISMLWRVACPSAAKGNDDAWINPVGESAPSLIGLACKRVLVCLAEKDFLRGRGWEYYEGLRRSGWGGVVEVLESEGEAHVFHLVNPGCDNAVTMMKRLACFFNGVE